MWRIGDGLGDHPLDLANLFHQVQLCRQTPCRICDDHVDFLRFRRLDCIEHDCGGIAAFLGNDGDVVALAPYFQLFSRRGAKCIAGCQQNGFPQRLEQSRELADGSRFSGAVYACNQNNERRGPGNIEWLLQRLQQLEQRLFEDGVNLRSIRQTLYPDLRAGRVEQMRGRFDTHVAGKQDRLHLLEQRFVYAAADTEHARELRAESRPRSRQPLPQFRRPARTTGIRDLALVTLEET